MTEKTKERTKVKLDGQFIVVTGFCPMCEWEQPHSHLREAFHAFLDERKAAKAKAGGTTNADKPALPKAGGTTAAKVSTPTTTTKPASTKPKTTAPSKPVKKINVYRIRTVGGGLSVDRSVMGERKKEAIDEAVKSHAGMVNVEESVVQLAFARYIGQLPVYEQRSYPQYGCDYGYGYGGYAWDL